MAIKIIKNGSQKASGVCETVTDISCVQTIWMEGYNFILLSQERAKNQLDGYDVTRLRLVL